MTPRYTLIVAADLNDCIGKAGELPWHLPSDLARFKLLTTGHDVIMGQTTSASILARNGKGLPGRRSLVVSRRRRIPAELTDYFQSPQQVTEFLTVHGTYNGDGEVFVIGGAKIYDEFLKLGCVERILLTRVHMRVEDGDTVMPMNWLAGFIQTEATMGQKMDERDEFQTSYTTYVRFKRPLQQNFPEDVNGRI